jgi:hypothetical protein
MLIAHEPLDESVADSILDLVWPCLAPASALD